MSFGFSVGDFIAVGQIVLKLYNACQNAPKEFQEISGELSSIHTVLFGLSEQAKDPTSLLLQRGGDRGLEWIQIRRNLEGTLAELQDLVNRYQTMGRNRWRHAKLGLEDLSTLRSKFSFHLSVVNTFVSSLSLSALGRMEPVLGRIECLLRESVREERAGHKTPTVLTAHETNNEVSWKQIEMDLLLEGIPREDYERNRDKIKEILNWVVSNETELANLRDVEPDDSASCVATKANSFGIQAFQLPSSALLMIDDIFRPQPAPEIKLDAYLDANHETGGSSSPSKLDFEHTPAMVDEVFGPSSFDQEAENASHRASVALTGDLDDIRSSPDLEPDRETTMSTKISAIISAFNPDTIKCIQCTNRIADEYYHCQILDDVDYDLCRNCYGHGVICGGDGQLNFRHKIMNARLIKVMGKKFNCTPKYCPYLVEDQTFFEPFRFQFQTPSSLPKYQEECGDENDHASDNESTINPWSFRRVSEWSDEGYGDCVQMHD